MDGLLVINNDTQTVSARELHEKLNIETPFKKWIDRMVEYGFEEGKDFWTKMSESTGGRPSTEYEITLDMAKQICMIQRTPEGKEVRQYLLNLEKAWNSPEMIMKRALEFANQAVAKLEAEIFEMKPKAEYFDCLVERKLLTNFRDTAKELHIPPKTFMNFLIDKKFVYRDQSGKVKPYQSYMQSGLFEIKEFVNQANGFASTQTLVTPKGRETFNLLIHKEGV